jgi:hypothetical protein
MPASKTCFRAVQADISEVRLFSWMGRYWKHFGLFFRVINRKVWSSHSHKTIVLALICLLGKMLQVVHV